MKLGKLAPKLDPRTLRFEHYLRDGLTAPTKVNRIDRLANWGMMGNDTVGDCTCAAAGHNVMLWTMNTTGHAEVISDGSILAAYSAVSGYVAGIPITDVGATCLDVLNYWRTSGIGGDKIAVFVSVNAKNLNHVRLATWLFGSTYIGFNCPQSAMDQFNAGRNWTVSGDGTIIGGHCVPIVAYKPDALAVITWGAVQWMSWNFLKCYCDEMYAVLDQDWIGPNKIAPVGFNFAQLQSDLATVTN